MSSIESNRRHGALHLIGRMALAATALVGSLAHADPRWPIAQRFNIGLGAFFLGTDTTVRVDGAVSTGRVIGTTFNFDDEFGFKDQNRLRVDGYWRFAERHKLRFMYFSSHSDETRNIDQTIEFRARTFPINAAVRGEFESEVVELAYEYAFLRRDSWELAATLGLHNLELKAGLSAQLSSTLVSGAIDQAAEATANGPLPVVGLHGLWAFGDHWYLDAQAQYFSVDFDEYDGSLRDYKLGIVWMPLRNIGVGVAYNDFRMHVNVDADRFQGNVHYTYSGPIGFVTVAF
jgi:hypothetical protein